MLEGLSLQWEKVHFMWVSEPVQTLNFSCTKFNTTYTQSTSTQMIQVRRMLQTSNLTGQTQFNLTHGLSQIRYTGLECLSHWILMVGIGFDTWKVWCLNWFLKVFSIKGPIENTYMFTSPTGDRPPYFARSSKGTKRPSCLQGKGATFISLVQLWESIPWPLVLQSSLLLTELILPHDDVLKQPFKC